MREIESFILTGGLSQRMKQNKAELILGEKTFVERIASALRPISSDVRLVGGNEIAGSNLAIVPDVFPSEPEKRRAAIIGLYSALFHARSEFVIVVACDMPFVSEELFKRLFSFLDENSDAAVPIQKDGRIQPLCAIYRRKKCLKIAADTLSGEDWSLRKFLEKLNVQHVNFEGIADLPDAENLLSNLNTPEDFQAARQKLMTEKNSD
jgi:molybdopterin-guanine dinucleotide biosynthesis protein A